VSIARPIDRIPPQNLDAEQSVLGSMLLDRDAIARVVEALRPEDFYRDVHRTIYTAMLELFERGEPVDLVTVTNKLGGMGKLEDVGGATYLASLPNTVPTAANAEFYAGIVLEKAMLRALIGAGTHIASLGYEGADDVAVLIDQAEKLVYGISARRNIQDFQTIKEILKASFEKIDKRYQEKGTVTGVATGFTDFDMLTSGLQAADMVIVAARPSVGKCLSADSEILLEDGRLATIEEIYQRRQGRLLTLGSDWTLRWTEPSTFVDDGIKPVFRVTTRLGRAVECTAVHPFLTIDGWLPLAALRTGDRVAVPRKVEAFGTRPLRECEITRIANAVGDGSLEPIPPAVFTTPREQVALFLHRLFAAAGWAVVTPASRLAQIGYGTVSERLARQIQHLLLRFGIIAGLRQTSRGAWEVQLTDPASTLTFAQRIGIPGRARWVKELLPVVAAGGRKPNPDALAPAVREEPLGRLASSDVYWDEIVSIEPVGSKQVYDLTIPNTHNFVANDICVHNTTLCTNIAQHAALTNKLPVAVFSLETSKEQLVQRILCSEARVDNTKLRTGFLADEDWRKLARAMGSLSEAPIFIDDSATLSVMEMRAKARKLKAEHGLGLIVIDYMQMIQSYKRAENRTQELSEIARGIKSLAKELDIPIIAISQLSRAVEALGSKRPMLSHLRECVAGETSVWDADTGRRYSIAELANAPRLPRLLSLNRAGQLVPVRPSALIEKGENAVFEVRTTTGRRLRATANHPVLTPTGWKKVGELGLGALVAGARSLPVFNPKPAMLNNDRLRLLGYLIGDGSYKRHRSISFISADALTYEDCIAIAEHEFNIVSRRGQANGTADVDFVAVYPTNPKNSRAYGRPHGNPLREWLRDLGVEGQSSYDKRIPEQVFYEADRGGLRALLRALFSTDGCLTRRKYSRNNQIVWSLHYDTVSLGLAEDVRDLLLRFGVVAQMSSGYRSKKGTVPIYRVCVENSRHLEVFCREIGIEGRKGVLADACLAELPPDRGTPRAVRGGRRAKPWIDRLPYSVTTELWALKDAAGLSWRQLGFRLQTGKTLDRPTAIALAERLKAKHIMQMASNDLLWDRVVSITPAGTTPVYDLVMPQTHNFVANGLIVHNSGEIEQVADLVIFLYREDYYDVEKAQRENKENVCEIIIAKHRNGPIGTIDLFFHKEFSRFENLAKQR